MIVVVFVISGSVPTFAGNKYPLGPTGLTGDVSRGQIKVIKVDKGSPADSKIKAGALIIGVGKTKFKGNPLRAFALAIDEAEAVGGDLTLMLDGNKEVVIQLQALGAYSPTAPYKCPKTDKIISLMAEYLVNGKKMRAGATSAPILGLMATGEKKYMDVATKMIKGGKMTQIDPKDVDAMLQGSLPMAGSVGWSWGYNLITLGEYYLLTKDKSVLPAMRTYALGLARGQDAGGLWGHRMATASRNGRLPGYAQMNQNSLTNFMGMLFAKKCGIEDPVLDLAIETSYVYFADHVDKGSFPYGVHGPQSSNYNNNGMSGSAAHCMALKGNRNGAKYFSKLSATSYDNLEKGHASSFFNPLWTPLGANLAGPEVTHQFFKKSLWFHNIRRGWDGRYGADGNVGSEAGYALLSYCLPRKALIITGREADQSIWLKGKAATDVVMMSKMDYKAKSVDELIAMLDDPIPQIPYQVVNALQKKKVGEVAPKLLALASSGTEREKVNAIAYFQRPPKGLPKEKVIEKLGSILRDKNETLQTRVAVGLAFGFGGFRELAYPYYNDILRLMEVERPDGLDPINRIDLEIAYSAARLCGNPWAAGLVTNKPLLYKVALKFMDHKRQEVRGCGVNMLVGIPIEDFHIVADKLVHVLDNKDPTYHSYHNPLSTSLPGVTLLSNLGIEEGLAYLEDIIFNQGGKWGFKIKMLMKTLPLYGANAKPYISKFEEHPSIAKEGDRFYPPWKEMVKIIEADKHPKKLISLEEAKKMGK